MSFAVELYTDLRKAISLRGVAEIIAQLFGVYFTYEAVRQSAGATKKLISHLENVGRVWHTDETYIKIKGKGYWLWIVYDKCQVLAWHISKKRTIKDARIVMRKAMHLAKIRPKKIITDGLYAYDYAIKKEIGWNWREHKKRYVVDSGIGKNAILKRLNREIKRRTKWFNTFQSLKGALAFFGSWFYHFNQRKLRHIT